LSPGGRVASLAPSFNSSVAVATDAPVGIVCAPELQRGERRDARRLRGLSVLVFFLTLYLQQVAGYAPIASGLALLPSPS